MRTSAVPYSAKRNIPKNKSHFYKPLCMEKKYYLIQLCGTFLGEPLSIPSGLINTVSTL